MSQPERGAWLRQLLRFERSNAPRSVTRLPESQPSPENRVPPESLYATANCSRSFGFGFGNTFPKGRSGDIVVKHGKMLAKYANKSA
jgi:hypothetical protein